MKGLNRYCDFTDDCGDLFDELLVICYEYPFRY